MRQQRVEQCKGTSQLVQPSDGPLTISNVTIRKGKEAPIWSKWSKWSRWATGMPLRPLSGFKGCVWPGNCWAINAQSPKREMASSQRSTGTSGPAMAFEKKHGVDGGGDYGRRTTDQNIEPKTTTMEEKMGLRPHTVSRIWGRGTRATATPLWAGGGATAQRKEKKVWEQTSTSTSDGTDHGTGVQCGDLDEEKACNGMRGPEQHGLDGQTGTCRPCRRTICGTSLGQRQTPDSPLLRVPQVSQPGPRLFSAHIQCWSKCLM